MVKFIWSEEQNRVTELLQSNEIQSELLDIVPEFNENTVCGCGVILARDLGALIVI